jgi:deazaflavin-dependent oxidoreductase (nitroreductase family)
VKSLGIPNVARVRARAHRWILQRSGARLFARLGGMPVIVLTTTGRRTGQPRSVAINAPLAIGNRIVVVASDGGSSHEPHWFRNLSRDPEVSVLPGGRPRRMLARVASPEEREELWPRVVARNGIYAQYQRRTSREIPLVWLDPIETQSES